MGVRKTANTDTEGGRRLVILWLPEVTSVINYSSVEKGSEVRYILWVELADYEEGVEKQELQDDTCFGNDLTAI